MLTIACVLRSGGRYNATWVRHLRANLAALSPPHRFVCLTDFDGDVGAERIPLLHPNWPGPGWWSILEVFRPGLFDGRVIYMDLANLVVAPIDPFVDGRGFIIAPDPYVDAPKRLRSGKLAGGGFASGITAFDAGDTELYDDFVQLAPDHIDRLHGDQEWMAERRPAAQTFRRGLYVSLKGDCLPSGSVPPGAVAIACHGAPKPPQVTDAWFRKIWDRWGHVF